MQGKLVWIGIAGALGAVVRYKVGEWVQQVGNGSFPWSTLAVNLLGCFLFGVVWAASDERLLIGGELRTILLAGFMGAFTTFSTFAFETQAFLRDGQGWLALANILVQIGAGLAAVIVGLALGRVM